MPNWCSNHLTIKGETDDVKRFKEQAVGYSPEHPNPLDEKLNVLQFHKLHPVPEEVIKADRVERWAREHWGCKWGACNSILVDEWDSQLIYEFDSAWNPPLEFIQHIAIQWPTLAFLLEYDKPGMCFKGMAKAKNTDFDHFCVEF